MVIMTMTNEIDKEFDEAKQTKNQKHKNNKKGSLLMMLWINFVIQLRNYMKVQSKSNLYEHFKEFLKQVGVKPFEYIYTEVVNEKNVSVID